MLNRPLSRRKFLKKAGAVAGAGALGVFTFSPKAFGAAAKGVVNLVTSPDDTTGVIWKYAQDSGLIGELADQYGYVVNVIRTWDDFPMFAGGHADIATFSALEVPALENQMQERLVVYGKLQSAYMCLAVRSDSGFDSPTDLVGKRFGINSWGGLDWKAYAVIIKKMWDIDFEQDHNIWLADYFVLNKMVADNELDACLTSPSHGATPYLISGELKLLLEEDVFSQEHWGFTPSMNSITARASWYEENPEAAEMMLKIWQLAVDQYYKDPVAMLLPYPELLGVTTEDEVRFYIDWAFSRGIPPVEEDVTIDQAWIDGQLEFINLGKEVGFIPKEAADPDFRIVTVR